MLCLRPPRKDDCLPKWDNSVVPFQPGLEKKGDDEPTSPRVGCMGQIKRNSKVVGFPIHHRCNNNSSNNSENKKRYFKLNKVFSGKNLNSFLLVKNLNTSIGTNYSKRQMIKGASRIRSYDDVSISVVDLDPPLPVLKPELLRLSTNTDGGDAVSDLWKRRCRGETLKALHLQQRNPSCVLGPNTL